MERFAIKIDKKLRANLYKICRLCGMDNPEMVPIISELQKDNELAPIDVEGELEMTQKINILLGLSITKDDRMPQSMCCLCVDKINDFYEFREMCYATNLQTRKLLGLKNIKKPALDIKPKVDVKQESIVPTPMSAPTSATSKSINRKRKVEEQLLKEEMSETTVANPKKKLRISLQAEATVKEENPVQTKKKLRFTAAVDEPTSPFASSSKKSKNNAVEDNKLKKEPSPPVPMLAPAVSNKKLRLAALPQKELATKKSKQKAGKNAEQREADVKQEIKEEIKQEPGSMAAAAPSVKVSAAKIAKNLAAKIPVAPKLKFVCNICKDRFPTKGNLEAHTRITHIPKVERYVCTACNEILNKSFDIKNHQLWHKLSKTPYVCGCCGESILNTYAFSRHLREHAFETPPALLVLDRECPQCHTSYRTNFLYNTHICAVKTRRCAGCNRLQRNDAEYLKHSAQCAKAYLSYSKHIMPSVEALEDAVRIKNENEVEAAAEEMARISGVPLDMAPVVQLTRLSSPVIMAASQCVSTTGLDDCISTSSKKSGKKGVSKKDLKRVDELLKSTLDALVSIKHEPEVHVDQETPCAGDLSDSDYHHEKNDHLASLDDLHHNDDSDHENEANISFNIANVTEAIMTPESGLEPIKIKQEIEENNEENSNKIGGGLKLKIKKEHGQLNSSIIEQQQSSEKRAEKRKKKKKHKEKEKDKQKVSKDVQDEQFSGDSIAHNKNIETNIENTTIHVKVEPQDGSEDLEKSLAPVLQLRPQPEATIMTSIPMMQFQIACVSSGVEFNNGANTAVGADQTTTSTNHDAEPEDVKPNRLELDRMLQISHVSSGVAMETDETEEDESPQMDHDGNYDKGNSGRDDHEESNEDDQPADENCFEYDEDNHNQSEDDALKVSKDTEINKDVIDKINKPLLYPKPKLTLKPKGKSVTTPTKSRNKACKSTAKPPNTPILQISAVQSCVTLDNTAPNTNEFIPMFIKPEPLYRGYSDEPPATLAPTSARERDETEAPEPTEELPETHDDEEENYISSIDFNNVTIKQEKDIEINDVQITQKTYKTYAKLNGMKRKRKQIYRSQCTKDKLADHDENDENIGDEADQETDEDDEEENDDEEVEEEEEEECEEEEDEEMEDDDDEEREYRELEYPPKLIEKNNDYETETENKETNDNNYEPDDGDNNSAVKENINDAQKMMDSNIKFVIANVCSQAASGIYEQSTSNANDEQILTSATISGTGDCNNTFSGPNTTKTMALSSSVPSSSYKCNNSVVTAAEISIAPKSQTENTHTVADTLAIKTLQPNDQPNETLLQIGKPFGVIPDGKLIDIFDAREQHQILDSTLHSAQRAENSEEILSRVQYALQNLERNTDRLLEPDTQQEQLQNTRQDIELNQGTVRPDCEEDFNDIIQHSITGAKIDQQETKVRSEYQQLQHTSQDTFEQSQGKQSNSTPMLEKLPHIEYDEVQAHTSTKLQTALEISSVRTTALNNIPELNIYPLRNNEVQQISMDNREDTATIVGTVQQSKNVNLEAQPVIENIDNESVNNDEVDADDNNAGVDENELEEDNTDDDDDDDESALGNNLEERQNYQNQEVLLQTRPTALALHPYLEDISSSSNSLLSNSLSQTPPLQSTTANVDQFNIQMQEQRRHLNTEETENILNESNDILCRRSLEEPETSGLSAGHLLTQPNLGQLLPPHMPTFNFDNINEIAENNNNANIEREQLQDEQQQYQQNQQQNTNNP